MQRIIITVAVLALLGGCSYFPSVHKIDIQQGNLVTQEMVDKLRPGMTKSQVQFIMGTPLVSDTFDLSRWDYLMTMKQGDQARTQERLTLFFKEDKLTHFNGDFRPSSARIEK